MSNEIAVKVEHVSKDFRLPHEKTTSVKSLFVQPFKKRGSVETQHALRGISFEVKKGEFFGIVGRNGSGKSTLLKIIAGIYQPSKGSISVDGRLVPFIELGVGFNPELTGRENVFLNGALMGFSPLEIRNKYKAIVEFAELGRFMDQQLKNYSSGMQVRLAFSVATILAESDILLIDEVLAVGDANFQRKCFDYFKELKKKKKTVVFVSHDMNAVREYCDRAVLIENNEIIEEGTSEKIAKAYQKLFLDDQTADVDSEPDEKATRWGDDKLVFNKPKISKTLLRDQDEDVTITLSVEAKEDVESPLFGFSIKLPTGEPLAGTNNSLKQRRIKSMKAGDKVTTVWTIPNIFSEGKHYIDIEAGYKDGFVVADRWEDALTFRVVKSHSDPYTISPNIKLSIDGKYEEK